MSDPTSTTRREFLKAAGTAAVGASLFPAGAFAQPRARRRYAVVGTGDRGRPYEGYRVAFNGEKGRLDVQSFERQPWEVADSHEIYVTRSFGKRTKVPIPKLTEGHGGGDDRMRDLIFKQTDAPEYMKLPDSRAGAMSCLTGIAIRNSIDQKKPIRIADLVRLS